MNQAIRKYAAKRKGFSMLELVIIIMIMTVLAGVMSPMFFQSKESANIAKADAEIGAIASAMKMYYAQNGQFPGTAADALADLAEAGLIPTATPVDPWGRAVGSANNLTAAPAADSNPSDTEGYVVLYSSAVEDATAPKVEGQVTDSATGQLLADIAIYVGYRETAGATGPATGKFISIIDNL